TSSAPGCQVRTTTRPSCSWAPRIANGSACSALSSACTSALVLSISPAAPLLSAIAVLHQGFAEFCQTGQRYIQPIRPVTGLVLYFVSRLLDAEQRQGCLLASAVLPRM